MAKLTAHEVQQLVSLRVSLEDALVRARSASKYRRGAAIVALDATVERVSSMVSLTRGLGVPSNGKLDDLISRLIQDLGNTWKPNVLPDIKHLRRARNASQHEGLEPDREQLPLWASATDTYVSSLIFAQFAVGIHQIVLSDAISDEKLRELMRLSEEALNAREYSESVKYSADAYRKALESWKNLHSRSVSLFPGPSRQTLNSESFEFLDKRLSNVQSILDMISFSPDIAEAEWFASVILERGDVFNDEDAQRTMAFSFEWIVGFEQAADSWTPNRRDRADVAARLVRSGSGPAYVESCLSVELVHGDIRALMRLGDVPNEVDFPLWKRTLQELLPHRAERLQWWFYNNGSVSITKKPEQSADFSVEIASLTVALTQVESNITEKWASAKSRLEEKKQAEQRAQMKFAEAMAPIEKTLPEWVTNIELRDDSPRPIQEQILVTLDAALSNSLFRGPNGHPGVRDLIFAHESINNCYGAGNWNQLVIEPVLTPQKLLEVLKSVDEPIRKQLATDRRKREEAEGLLVNARKSIASALSEL